ncbi:MAG: sulfatase-like hydrolase/transferase [Anaerolineae bacterium]|nr:sulfatase-like hydrolase/transferase [Anaerolineae bacterium]
MNFVLIMTDTQNKSMVGAYGTAMGGSAVDTPNLDRLAETGIRFERAYTSCPLCTPARSGLFSGTHPPVNGAWCNNVSPSASIPLMGTILGHYGFRTAYTGKWHLDGSGYFGDGVPGGGFEPDWWYDGKRYAQDIGLEMFRHYQTCRTADELRAAGFTEENIWGHRVADRAIDFMDQVGNDPFALVVSFDEPHGPHVAPPEYWERFSPEDIPLSPNYNAPLTCKPPLQHVHRQCHGDVEWLDYAATQTQFFGCNSYIDREIGRVVDAVERLHGDNTVILYTSDHGDMLGGHGLRSKGPMMYQEITNIPLIVHIPGGPRGAVSHSLASHVDLIPTMLDLTGIERPPALHGTSLVPILRDPDVSVQDSVMVSFTRFAINHDDWGEFYPIRCLVGDRYKLAVNLFETDELYDLQTDPYEMTNLIDHPEHAATRDRLHDALLAEMDRIRDPFRSFRWGDRRWRSVRHAFYHGGERRGRPAGFPFQMASIEADGTWSGS